MKEDYDLLYSIAVMYYREGLNQQEISNRIGISRPLVSRALARAQQCGIVEIKLNPPESCENLGDRLAKALGLKSAFVAPATDGLSNFASSVLKKELAGEKNIGIGWGDTVYRTIINMTSIQPEKKAEHNIVSLVGSIGIKEPHYQVNILVGMMAQAIGGTPFFFNGTKDTIDCEENRAEFGEVISLWNNLDAAVIGLGPFPSNRFPDGTYSENENKKFADCGAVGDILGHFFSEDGFIEEWSDGHLAISDSALKHTPKVICICGGREKVKAAVAAAKLGYYSTLVTDTRTAEEIIKLTEGEK